MALNQVTTYLKYANVQMAAESLFGLTNSNAAPGENSPVKTILSLTTLTDGNGRASKFPTTLATQFLESWELVEHIANTKTGFSGTLFKAKATNAELGITEGELVLSFRSTEFADDAAPQAPGVRVKLFSTENTLTLNPAC